MTAPLPDSERPNPLRDAAKSVAALWATLATIVGALVQFGVLNAAQGDALTTAGTQLSPTLLLVGTVVAGVVPLVTGLVAAFRTAAKARPEVTPVADPRAEVRGVLVPMVPERAAGGGPFAAPDDGPRHAR